MIRSIIGTARPHDHGYWRDAKAEANWLGYQLAPRPDGRLDKLPAHPITGRGPISIYKAACLTFDQAMQLASERGCGIGYLPRPGSSLIGIDLDKCVKPWADAQAENARDGYKWFPETPSDGVHVGVAGWAVDLLLRYKGWSEISQSGRGLRAIAARDRATPGNDAAGNGAELIVSGRKFFTVTFRLLHFRRGFIVGASELTRAVLAHIAGAAVGAPPRPVRSVERSSEQSWWFDRLPPHRQDEELERMLGFLVDDEFGEYETWIRITAGLWRADCPDETWDARCQQLPSYNAAENAYKWSHGFGHVPNPATIGSIIRLARQRGYQPPRDAFDHWARPLARRYSPEELTDLDSRFRAGLAKRSALA
jgi:hypothetical protein